MVHASCTKRRGRESCVASGDLGGHLKCGQSGSGQIRPVEARSGRAQIYCVASKVDKKKVHPIRVVVLLSILFLYWSWLGTPTDFLGLTK
jgi:hypothetical protein